MYDITATLERSSGDEITVSDRVNVRGEAPLAGAARDTHSTSDR
jgi:hypothetical protein